MTLSVPCAAGGREVAQAVLVVSGVEIPFTHDLSFLVEIAVDRDLRVPDGVSAAKWLTPWAVVIRYGTAEASLERGTAVAVADEAVFVARRNHSVIEITPGARPAPSQPCD